MRRWLVLTPCGREPSCEREANAHGRVEPSRLGPIRASVATTVSALVTLPAATPTPTVATATVATALAAPLATALAVALATPLAVAATSPPGLSVAAALSDGAARVAPHAARLALHAPRDEIQSR